LDIKYLRYRGLFAKDLNILNAEIEAFFHEENNADKRFEDLINENENFKKKYESFLKKYFINFVLEIKIQEKSNTKIADKDKKLDELGIYSKDVDKLFTYFLAHVCYLIIIVNRSLIFKFLYLLFFSKFFFSTIFIFYRIIT
jgi:uncharacterized protein YaaW (UPF0174 family)